MVIRTGEVISKSQLFILQYPGFWNLLSVKVGLYFRKAPENDQLLVHWLHLRIPGPLWPFSSMFNPSNIFLETVFPSSTNEDTPVLLEDPVLCAMAKKYKRTPALIALRYQLQRGIVVLAKSFNEEHIRENMQVTGH